MRRFLRALASLAFVAGLVGCASLGTPSDPPIGWREIADGTYEHIESGVTCPTEIWGIERARINSASDNELRGSCEYETKRDGMAQGRMAIIIRLRVEHGVHSRPKDADLFSDPDILAVGYRSFDIATRTATAIYTNRRDPYLVDCIGSGRASGGDRGYPWEGFRGYCSDHFRRIGGE